MSFTTEVIRDVYNGKIDIDLASVKLGLPKKVIEAKVAEYDLQYIFNNLS